MATLLSEQKPEVLERVQANTAARKQKALLIKFGITSLAVLLLSLWVMPLFYGIVTSLKTKEQISDPKASILPAAAISVEFEGKEYDVYSVPFEDGTVRELALYLSLIHI